MTESVTDAVQHATSGVRLRVPDALMTWRDVAGAERRPGTRPALDWMLMVEALSDARPQVVGRLRVRVSQLAEALGENDGTARKEGAVYSGYDRLWSSLRSAEADDGPSAMSDPITRLYRQARMATFLEYRQGFSEHLSEIPFSAEVAIHAYLRIVLEWAIRWRGLTLATALECHAAAAEYASVGSRSRAQRAEEKRRSWLALPMIVGEDLRSLLRLARTEAGDVTSAAEYAESSDDSEEPVGFGWQIELAVETLVEQLLGAVTHIIDDPTLSALTSGNIVRLAANHELGGALQRIRARSVDVTLIQQQVLDEVHRLFVAPHHKGVVNAPSFAMAAAEQRFGMLKVAVSAFGSIEKAGE